MMCFLSMMLFSHFWLSDLPGMSPSGHLLWNAESSSVHCVRIIFSCFLCYVWEETGLSPQKLLHVFTHYYPFAFDTNGMGKNASITSKPTQLTHEILLLGSSLKLTHFTIQRDPYLWAQTFTSLCEIFKVHWTLLCFLSFPVFKSKLKGWE